MLPGLFVAAIVPERELLDDRGFPPKLVLALEALRCRAGVVVGRATPPLLMAEVEEVVLATEAE